MVANSINYVDLRQWDATEDSEELASNPTADGRQYRCEFSTITKGFKTVVILMSSFVQG